MDEDRWDEVSQLMRIKHKMPSTTNALEAFHGHLNDDVPRRNEFWASLFRIITSLMKKKYFATKKVFAIIMIKPKER